MRDIRQIEDMKLIQDWNLRHQMLFIFEVLTEAVKHILPHGIEPLEARPGISLMEMGFNDYNPGNVIYGQTQSAFVELTRTILVQPDLSIDMPMPRFTFFVDRILSNNEPFLRQESEVLHLPCYYSPSLKIETNEAKTEMIASDDDGKIEELINTNASISFKEDDIFGQYFTVQDGKLYLGIWYWSGKVFIHQKSGYAGRIYNHPFLTGGKLGILPEMVEQPYIQHISAFNEPIVNRFYKPRFIRNI